MEKIDKAAARKISAALEDAAQMVADDLGLNVKVGGGRFDPAVGTFSPKVEFSIGGAEEREFGLEAPLFGLTAEDYGASFESGGKSYRLVALKPRSPRYPVIGERPDGKRFKFTELVLNPLKNDTAKLTEQDIADVAAS